MNYTMNRSVQGLVALLVCALWLSPLCAYAAPEEGKTAPAKAAATPAKATAAPAKAAAAPAKATAQKSKAKKGVEESAEVIKSKLDTMGKQLVVKAAGTVSPSISKKAVSPEGGSFVARYTEIDTSEVITEVMPSTGSGGKYIGSIKYRENQYECRGKTHDEALRASCDKVKTRRMNELVRYDGKWMF
ncbi:MAG: translation initiation factor 2 [Desulfovibrionaceae bacterium]